MSRVRTLGLVMPVLGVLAASTAPAAAQAAWATSPGAKASQTARNEASDPNTTEAPKPAPQVLDGRDGHDLALDQFRPRSMLRVEEHLLTRAKFPVVDVHV